MNDHYSLECLQLVSKPSRHQPSFKCDVQLVKVGVADTPIQSSKYTRLRERIQREETGTISTPIDHATDLRLFFSFLSDFFSLSSPATSDFLDFFFSFFSLDGAESAAAAVVVGSSSTSIISAFRFTCATLCSRCGSTRSTIALVVVSVAPKGRFRNFSFSSG